MAVEIRKLGRGDEEVVGRLAEREPQTELLVVDEVDVDEAHRRQGIASRLFEELAAAARERASAPASC